MRSKKKLFYKPSLFAIQFQISFYKKYFKNVKRAYCYWLLYNFITSLDTNIVHVLMYFSYLIELLLLLHYNIIIIMLHISFIHFFYTIAQFFTNHFFSCSFFKIFFFTFFYLQICLRATWIFLIISLLNRFVVGK